MAPEKGVFLQPGAEKQVLSNVEDKAEFLLMVLSQMEDAHLLEVAKQALRQNVKKCCNSL